MSEELAGGGETDRTDDEAEDVRRKGLVECIEASREEPGGVGELIGGEKLGGVCQVDSLHCQRQYAAHLVACVGHLEIHEPSSFFAEVPDHAVFQVDA